MYQRFEYPRNIVNKFLNGNCGALALELNKLTGWPLRAVYILETNQELKYSVPAHYLVEKSPGLYVDIIGIRNETELAQELPVSFDIPADRIIITSTNETLGNTDYKCSIEDTLLAKIYAKDIVMKIK